jgi:uncharacterized protein (UPF0335 family)
MTRQLRAYFFLIEHLESRANELLNERQQIYNEIRSAGFDLSAFRYAAVLRRKLAGEKYMLGNAKVLGILGNPYFDGSKRQSRILTEQEFQALGEIYLATMEAEDPPVTSSGFDPKDPSMDFVGIRDD